MVVSVLLATCFFSAVHLSSSAVTIPTIDGNGNKAPCVFPFIYNSKSRETCIFNDHNRPWCATTNNYDSDKKWGQCEIPFGVKKSVGGNVKGESCAFPFIYRGVTYNFCTSVNNPRFWCSTTDNYDKDQRWGRCSTFISVQTENGNGGGAPCYFPFLYGGRNISGCISDGVSAKPWCATTDDFNRDGKWGECILSDTTVKTEGGNADDADCVFPYSYNGLVFHTCNSELLYAPWCSTTSTYNGKFGMCKLPLS